VSAREPWASPVGAVDGVVVAGGETVSELVAEPDATAGALEAGITVNGDEKSFGCVKSFWFWPT